MNKIFAMKKFYDSFDFFELKILKNELLFERAQKKSKISYQKLMKKY